MVEESETVPCIWCAKPTAMLATRHCDGCYELSRRIRMNLDLTRKILRVEHNIASLSRERSESDSSG